MHATCLMQMMPGPEHLRLAPAPRKLRSPRRGQHREPEGRWNRQSHSTMGQTSGARILHIVFIVRQYTSDCEAPVAEGILLVTVADHVAGNEQNVCIYGTQEAHLKKSISVVGDVIATEGSASFVSDTVCRDFDRGFGHLHEQLLHDGSHSGCGGSCNDIQL